MPAEKLDCDLGLGATLVSLRKSTLKDQGAASHEEINLTGTPGEIFARLG